MAGHHFANERRGIATRPVDNLSYQIIEAPHEPHGPVDLLRDWWPSFRQLESLTFRAGYLPSLTQIGAYTAFQRTVTYLRLPARGVSPCGIFALVNYFPNLAQLELIDLYTYRPLEDHQTPPFSRPLQKLSFWDLHGADGCRLIDGVMSLRPQCDEVTIGMLHFSDPTIAQHVVDGVGASVTRLKLVSDLAGAYDVRTILL